VNVDHGNRAAPQLLSATDPIERVDVLGGLILEYHHREAVVSVAIRLSCTI
jgi:hypothetical protein